MPGYFNSENARENQKKSVEVRRQNATIREATEYALDMPLKNQEQLQELLDFGYPKKKRYSVRDYVIFKVCGNVMAKGKPDDLLKLMEITGEDTESAIVEDSAAYFEAGELTDADREND